jgi:hypothetical protein
MNWGLVESAVEVRRARDATFVCVQYGNSELSQCIRAANSIRFKDIIVGNCKLDRQLVEPRAGGDMNWW